MRFALALLLSIIFLPADAAEISGRILLKGQAGTDLNVGFIAKKNGQPFNCGCGMDINASTDSGSVSCLTFKPYTSTLSFGKADGCSYRHKVPVPGKYFVYVKWNDTYLWWKVVEVKSASEKITLDVTLDASRAGAVRFQIPDRKHEYKLRLSPVDRKGNSPYPVVDLSFWLDYDVEAKGGVAAVPSMRPGEYQVQVQRTRRIGDAAVFDDVGTYRISVKPGKLRKYTVPMDKCSNS